MTEVTTDKVAEAMATVDREMAREGSIRRFGNGTAQALNLPRVERPAAETGTLPQWLEHFGKALASMDARLAKIEKFLGV